MERQLAKIYGVANSAEAYEVRDFLQRNAYPFQWFELRSDLEAHELAGVEGLLDSRLPICEINGSRLYRPSPRDLASALDWFKGPKQEVYDVAIFGAGPAGLSAAVYAASEGLRTLVIERSAVGGQAGSTTRIENYLGFPDGISGWELASRARDQAQRLGAEIIVTDEGIFGESKDGRTVSWLASGKMVSSRATICATGVEYSRLGIANEDAFLNRGLFYGAGASEAHLCSGRVFIVGGGNSAGQAALNFSRFASQVTMLIRGTQLKDTLSSYLVDRIEQAENIEVKTQTELCAVEGAGRLESIRFRSLLDGFEEDAETNWLFVCIGGRPRTDWAHPGTVLTDASGYILTGDDLRDLPLPEGFWTSGRRPSFMEASMPGLFVAGDVRHDSIKRCATAVGEGATAVSMVHKYLASLPPS